VHASAIVRAMSKGDELQTDTLQGATLGASESVVRAADVRAPVLTILWHPDVARVGERSRLNDPGGKGRVRLSRLHPAFGPPAGLDATPLAVPHLSRRPLHLDILPSGAVRVCPEADATALRVDGRPLSEERLVSPEELVRGVVLELARRVVLLLHAIPPVEREERDTHGIIGHSQGICEVRAQVERVALHDVAVLVRGESGTGKELVAEAIHRMSTRRNGPLVSVNMAALVVGTASSALFGHEKGSFTGATGASDGLFGKADGGTLFMDEIGETPDSVQPALLRALESGEVQPVGAAVPVRRSVRIIAATDARLEDAVAAGTFRLPLLQRLAGYELHLPPLRERREDVGRLLLHFLREQLARIGKADVLARRVDHERPWLPAELVTRAALAPWPGNVRELRNVVQKLVIDYGSEIQVGMGAAVDRLLPEPGAEARTAAVEVPESEAAGSGGRRLLRDIPEDQLIDAFKRHDYQPGPAAKELGISRTSLYALIESSDKLRKAGELSSDEIGQSLAAAGGDVRLAARTLEVSERGLRLRMKQLGLS
jgi:two-component system, NtrC family, nitrogen regulation response regulator GlnG